MYYRIARIARLLDQYTELINEIPRVSSNESLYEWGMSITSNPIMYVDKVTNEFDLANLVIYFINMNRKM